MEQLGGDEDCCCAFRGLVVCEQVHRLALGHRLRKLGLAGEEPIEVFKSLFATGA